MKKTMLLRALVLAAGVAFCTAASAQPAPPPMAPDWEHRVPGPEMEMGWKRFQPDGMGPGMEMGWKHFRPNGMGMGMPGRVRFYLEGGRRLGLSEDQLGKLRIMRFEFEKTNVKRRADLETAQLELEQLRSTELADAKQVEAKIREVFTKRADLAVAAFDAQLAADKVLTDDQRAKLKSWSARGGHGEHGEHGEDDEDDEDDERDGHGEHERK